MTELQTGNPPSPFIARWIRRLQLDFATPGLALDVAAGRGRHTRALAEAGFNAVGIDRDFAALTEGRRVNAAAPRYSLVCADLEKMPLAPGRFQVVVVSRYLDRSLFESLLVSLVPGGALIYETFTTRQLALGHGPRSLSHLLNPGELRQLVTTSPSERASASETSSADLPVQRLVDGTAQYVPHDTVDILFDEEVARTSTSAVARLVARKRVRADR